MTYARSPLARRKKTMPIDGKTSSSLQLTKDRILIFLLFLFTAVKKTENVFKETKKIWAGKFHRFFIFLIWKCLTLSQIFSVIQSNRYNRMIDNMRIIRKMNRSTFSGFLVTSNNTTLCVWDFLQYFLANSLACLLIEHYYWSTAAQFGLAPVRSAERDETCSNLGRTGPTLRVLK